MHSEHLNNVHPGWVVGGWLVSIAVASAAYLIFVSMGLASGAGDDAPWVVVAVAAGFFTGGFFVGIRWAEAPILHGLIFGIVSLVVLLVANLFFPGGSGADSLTRGSVTVVLSMLLVQTGAAIAGGVVGRRTLRGEGLG